MLFHTYRQINQLKEILKNEFGWDDLKIENYFREYVEIEGSKYYLTEDESEKRRNDLWELLNTKFKVLADVGYSEYGLFTDLDDIVLIPKTSNKDWLYICR